MSSSIDIGAICLGMAIGYGLRKEIRSTGEVCRNALLAAVAGAAATAAAHGNGQANQGQANQGGNNGN